MDVHVPAAITAGLRQLGHDVVTSKEDGSRTWSDERLLQRTTELGRVLFSQDQDLLVLADIWQRQGRAFGGIVFAAQQATSIGQLIADLALIADCCGADEILNRVVFVPLL